MRRDRVLVASALVAVIAGSWAYLLVGAGMSMHEMDGMLMPMRMGPWTLGYGGLMLVMWSVMMAAMSHEYSIPPLSLKTSICLDR